MTAEEKTNRRDLTNWMGDIRNDFIWPLLNPITFGAHAGILKYDPTRHPDRELEVLVLNTTYGGHDDTIIVPGGGAESNPREISRWISAGLRKLAPKLITRDFIAEPDFEAHELHRDEEIWQEAGLKDGSVNWIDYFHHEGSVNGSNDITTIFIGHLLNHEEPLHTNNSKEVRPGSIGWMTPEQILESPHVHHVAEAASRFIIENFGVRQ